MVTMKQLFVLLATVTLVVAQNDSTTKNVRVKRQALGQRKVTTGKPPDSSAPPASPYVGPDYLPPVDTVVVDGYNYQPPQNQLEYPRAGNQNQNIGRSGEFNGYNNYYGPPNLQYDPSFARTSGNPFANNNQRTTFNVGPQYLPPANTRYYNGYNNGPNNQFNRFSYQQYYQTPESYYRRSNYQNYQQNFNNYQHEYFRNQQYQQNPYNTGYQQRNIGYQQYNNNLGYQQRQQYSGYYY